MLCSEMATIKLPFKYIKTQESGKIMCRTVHFPLSRRLVEITLGTNDKSQVKDFIEEDDLGANYNKLTFSEKLEMEEIYPETCLDRLLPHYKFYNDKGISTETLKSLKGGYATTGKLNNRFIFPIYNEHNQIHGFSGRDMSSLDASTQVETCWQKERLDLPPLRERTDG